MVAGISRDRAGVALAGTRARRLFFFNIHKPEQLLVDSSPFLFPRSYPLAEPKRDRDGESICVSLPLIFLSLTYSSRCSICWRPPPLESLPSPCDSLPFEKKKTMDHEEQLSVSAGMSSSSSASSCTHTFRLSKQCVSRYQQQPARATVAYLEDISAGSLNSRVRDSRLCVHDHRQEGGRVWKK